ncbi:long-chain acyl-CoA synthetase [Nocardiopsis mwathae]|uniref:Long-chain acyl-CoA synthetase n=1 Tax=Nocardiopsis mwathae TaxID=1472723 RepID=A0A7W9YG23_9ACTN|nr:AMP-binding protein [Nocardiopsis mwathae]MBB6171504.1 long-chain acyl-CoA synthetase [Nocardiopsis mwathae]
MTSTDPTRPLRPMAAVTARMLVSGSPFEIEIADVNGTATRVWKHTPPHLRAVLEAAGEHGDAPALVYERERMTHAEFQRAAATLARRLAEDNAVAKGDRVAIAMRNHPEWVIAFFAATSIGAIAVPLNSWWAAGELEFGLSDSGAKVLIADQERTDRLADALPRLGVPVIAVRSTASTPGRGTDGERRPFPAGTRTWAQVLGPTEEHVLPPDPGIAPDDPAAIFYTSGTTGTPKGAVASHRNMLSNIVSLNYARVRSLMRIGLDFDDGVGYLEALPRPVVLCPVPLFHATGAQTIMLPTVARGGTLVLMHRWDAEDALRLVERERVTGITAVPTMVAQMLASPRLGEYDLSSLLSLGTGGAPAAPALVSRAHGRLHDLVLAQGYGLTECSATASLNAATDYLLRPDSAGVPVAAVDVKIVDAEGAELPPGEPGEIWLNGPGVVLGYWQRPEATAATFVDGWLRTGDIGRMDDEGFLYVVDRIKDVIIRGGENVYCSEVEAAIHEHPAVHEVAVVGVPHEVYGEEVGAVVRLHSGHRLAPGELRDHLKSRLAAFKIPDHIRVVDDGLPRNAAGKLLKKQVRTEQGWIGDG